MSAELKEQPQANAAVIAAKAAVANALRQTDRTLGQLQTVKRMLEDLNKDLATK